MDARARDSRVICPAESRPASAVRGDRRGRDAQSARRPANALDGAQQREMQDDALRMTSAKPEKWPRKLGLAVK